MEIEMDRPEMESSSEKETFTDCLKIEIRKRVGGDYDHLKIRKGIGRSSRDSELVLN